MCIRDRLVFAPEIDALKQLPNSTPKACTVRDWMVRFDGGLYDLREIPGGLENGQKVMVVRNALDTVKALSLIHI